MNNIFKSLFVLMSLASMPAAAFLYREGESAAFVKTAAHTADLKVYKITLNSSLVNQFLPHMLQMSIDAGVIPKLAVHRHSLGLPIRVLKHFMLPAMTVESEISANDFFRKLKLYQKYTYVVLPNKLALTETANEPSEKYKDLASKHMLLSGLKKYVRYAGEMHLERDFSTGELVAIFDNASGTYRPPQEELGNLAQLLTLSLLRPNDEVRFEGRART